MSWTVEKVLKFLKEVEKWKILWKKNHNYHDVVKKEEDAWRELKQEQAEMLFCSLVRQTSKRHSVNVCLGSACLALDRMQLHTYGCAA